MKISKHISTQTQKNELFKGNASILEGSEINIIESKTIKEGLNLFQGLFNSYYPLGILKLIHCIQ